MSTKNQASDLVRGLSMAINFIDVLQEEIEKVGGYPEMLHFLTKEQGRPIAAKIAQMIAESDWRIPFSLIKRLAREEVVFLTEPWNYNRDCAFGWGDLSKIEERFGIPVLTFRSRENAEEVESTEHLDLRSDLEEQIMGKRLGAPFFVTWNGESHVITYLDGYDDGKELSVGDKVTEILAVKLARASYFNFDQ